MPVSINITLHDDDPAIIADALAAGFMVNPVGDFSRTQSTFACLPPGLPLFPPAQPDILAAPAVGTWRGHEFHFSVAPVTVTDDEIGDCGFMALDLTRDQAIKQLRARNNDATVRRMVGYEIRALVRGYQLPTNFAGFDPQHLFKLEAIPVVDRTDEQTQELQGLELSLEIWSKDQRTYDAFIDLYESNRGREREWLTYLPNNEGRRVGVLGALCYVQGIFNLCIWRMNPQTRIMQSEPSFYFGDPSHNTCIHLLFTGNHYHRLVEKRNFTATCAVPDTPSSPGSLPPVRSTTPEQQTAQDLFAALGTPKL